MAIDYNKAKTAFYRKPAVTAAVCLVIGFILGANIY